MPYASRPVPPVNSVSATTPIRTRVGSMLRYSPMPPHTPESMRCSRERRRVLPEKALLFVMTPRLVLRRRPQYPDRYRTHPGTTLRGRLQPPLGPRPAVPRPPGEPFSAVDLAAPG